MCTSWMTRSYIKFRRSQDLGSRLIPLVERSALSMNSSGPSISKLISRLYLGKRVLRVSHQRERIFRYY